MALFVLIILGLSLGWFSSILARTEAPRAILSQMGVAMIAALGAGIALNSGTILGGLSHFGLGAGIVAALVALVAYHALVTRSQTVDAPAE